jgi:hypothetical protein
MTTSIDFEKLQDLKDSLTIPMQKYTGKPALFPNVTDKLTKSVPFELAGAKGSIASEGSIELFNSKDDNDSAGILGTKSSDAQNLSPSIIYNKQSCWLKYAVQASLKGTADHSLSDLNIGIDSSASLQLSAYKQHQPDKKIASSLASDLTSIPLITDISDILALKPEEAVALDAEANLSAQASFTWSDVLAQSVSTLSQWLEQGELLNLKIDASVSAKINLTIEGGFKLVFSRDANTQDKVRLAMKKSTGTNVTGTLGAGISAQLANPDDFKLVYTDVLNAIFDEPLSVIEQIEEGTSVEGLPEVVQDAANKLKNRLGADDLDTLKQKISDIRTKLEGVITKAASTKAELSFTYEYERLSTHQSLAELLIDDNMLGEVHKNALSAKLLDITAMADGNGIKLERFFYQKSTEIKSSWGFNLGFGSWSALSRDYGQMKIVESRNAKGDRKLSTIALKGYKSSWGSDKRDFYVNFEAKMNEFLDKNQNPRVSDFNLSLSVLHTFETETLSNKEATLAMDSAAVWGVIPSDMIEDEAQSLVNTLSDARNIKIIYSLNIPDESFIKVLAVLAKGEQNQIARSLASALPPMRVMRNTRSTPALREYLYAATLEDFISGRIDGSDNLAGAIKKYLKSHGYTVAANREGDWRSRGSSKQLLGGLTQSLPYMRRDIANLSSGMSRLHTAYLENANYQEIKRSYQLFDDMGEQSYYNNFFANYLRRCARLSGANAEDIRCSVKIEYELSGKQQDIILGTAD